MADNSFKDYIIKLLLVGLFIICIVTFLATFTTKQGKDSSMITEDHLDVSKLEKEINKTSEDAEGWKDAFTSDNLFVALGSIVLFSIWSVGNLILTSILNIFILILDTASTVLGIPPMILGVIIALLIISLIFALWRVIKRGD